MAITSGRIIWCLCSSVCLILAVSSARAETKLFESVQVTPAGQISIALDGYAKSNDVLTEFLDRLNRSGFFDRAMLGPLLVDTMKRNQAYPTHYSLSMILRGS